MPNPRKPRDLKIVQGTWRRDRDRPEAAYPALRDATPPAWVHEPDALKLWNEIVALLAPIGMLTEADRSALGHLCNLHAEIVRLYRRGEAPNASMLAQLRMFAGEFGLTPATRSRASPVGTSAESNPFDLIGGNPHL